MFKVIVTACSWSCGRGHCHRWTLLVFCERVSNSMQWAWGRGPKNNHSLLTPHSPPLRPLSSDTHTYTLTHTLPCDAAQNQSMSVTASPRGCSSHYNPPASIPAACLPRHSPAGSTRAWARSGAKCGSACALGKEAGM